MVALIENRPRKETTLKKCFTDGGKVSKKYKKAAIKRAEYKKLKAIIPSVANEKAVSKLTVIEEAIKYIDQLHSALVKKVLTSDCNNNINSHNTESNTVLNNLQRSCDNKSLPFSSADEFIRSFILQQHCQVLQQQHHPLLTPQRRPSNLVAIKNLPLPLPLTEKGGNAEQPTEQMRFLSQQNTTTTTTEVVSVNSRRPLSDVLPPGSSPGNTVTSSNSSISVNLRAKRILF